MVILIDLMLRLFFTPFLIVNGIKKKSSTCKDIPQKILIVEYFRLGDVVLTTGLAKTLKKKYPNVKVHLAGSSNYKSYFRDEYDKFIEMDVPWIKSTFASNNIIKSIIRIVNHIIITRSEHYDIIIDARCDLRSACFVFFMGGKQTIGFNNQLGDYFFTDLIEYSEIKQKNDDYKKIASYLNCDLNFCYPQLLLKNVEQLNSNETKIMRNINPLEYFCIHYGASWKFKNWGFEKYIILANKIESMYNIKAFWIVNDIDSESLILKQNKNNIIKQPSFDLLKMLLSNSLFLICNNSGPMHVADAVGCRTISFLGPSSAHWLPSNEKLNHIVIKPVKHYECMPCYETTCIHEEYSCLSSISVDDAFAKIVEEANYSVPINKTLL